MSKARSSITQKANSFAPKNSANTQDQNSSPSSSNPLTQKLKAIYRAQDTLPKLIEDASVPEQKMDDYYVKLQIVLDDKKGGLTKPPIDIGKIFDPAADQGGVGRVLIIGAAGVGKTTLLNHVTYEWSKGSIFDKKFDYVLKVKLKNLLNNYLCNEIADLENSEDYLPMLIQRSLEEYQLEQKQAYITAKHKSQLPSEEGDESIYDIIPLEEIKSISRSKTLLLLDGYDEIEHLDRGGHIAREIMNSIFEFPNVLMTSRPNAIASNVESRFERKIENVGIGEDGAREYIANYFLKQTNALIKEIDRYENDYPTKKTLFNLLNYYDSMGDSSSKELEIYFRAIDDVTRPNKNLEIFKQSITNYHSKLAESLQALYQNNPSFKEILSTDCEFGIT